MILMHDYAGGAGRCNRCGIPRRFGVGMPCELPEEMEEPDWEVAGTFRRRAPGKWEYWVPGKQDGA